jgi:hypothetical protein
MDVQGFGFIDPHVEILAFLLFLKDIIATVI